VAIGNIAGVEAAVKNITTESNQVVIGNNSTTNAFIKVAWTTGSDARDKICFNDINHGLNFVNQLKPVSFYFRECRESEIPYGSLRYGFKAQDVLELEGTSPVIVNNCDSDYLKLNETYLIPILVNAIKELKAEIEILKNK
jgi:hypothetical protein